MNSLNNVQKINIAFIVQMLSGENYLNKYDQATQDKIRQKLEETIESVKAWVNRIDKPNWEELLRKNPDYKFNFPYNFFYERNLDEGTGGIGWGIWRFVCQYSTDLIIGEEMANFPFFFGLVFSWLSKEQAKGFLKFHYRYYFERDINKFIIFLDRASADNKQFFKDNWLLSEAVIDDLKKNLPQILGESDSETKSSKNNDSPKLFQDYLLHPQKERLVNALKITFNQEKGKSISLLLRALEQRRIFVIPSRQGKKIYDSLKACFNRDIGTYNSIFTSYKYDENKDKTDFDTTEKKLDIILEQLKTSNAN